MNTWIRFGLAGVIGASLLLMGCGIADDYNDDRGKGDAGVASRDDSDKEVINMPNDFSNIAHACDGHGHRVYTTTHESGGGRGLYVIEDPSCSG